MNQILINLIGNAIKFTKQGGIKVIVEDPDNHIITRIRDTGMGIPKDELGRNIFLNGEYSGLERPVMDEDRLGIFPDNMQLLYRQYFKKVEED